MIHCIVSLNYLAWSCFFEDLECFNEPWAHGQDVEFLMWVLDGENEQAGLYITCLCKRGLSSQFMATAAQRDFQETLSTLKLALWEIICIWQ